MGIGEAQCTMHDMLDVMGLKDREHFVNAFLSPAMKGGFVGMLYPNTPRHPRQRYHLTAKGIAQYDALKGTLDGEAE